MANSLVSTGALAELTEHMRAHMAEAWHKGANDVLLALLELKPDPTAFGRRHVIRVRGVETAATSGGGLTVAQTISADGAEGSTTLSDRFEVDPIMIDAVQQIKRAEWLESKAKGEDEVFDVLDRATQSCMKAIRKRTGIWACGDGTGVIATVTGGTTTIPIIDEALCNRIKAGDRLVFDDGTGAAGSSMLDSGNPRRVTANPMTGSITLSASVSGLVVGSRIFFQNHIGTTQVPQGSFLWIPQTPSDPFNGVTRTGKPWLTGYLEGTSSLDTTVKLIRAASKMAANDRSVSHAIVSYKTWELLTADKDASKIVEVKAGKYEIGFPGIVVHGAAGGTFKVVPSMFMPPGQGLMGRFEGTDSADNRPYFVYGGDSLVNIDDTGTGTDGVRQREEASDYELRCFSYLQLCFPNPGDFMQLYNMATS